MNKEKFTNLLASILHEFFFHFELVGELAAIFKNSGQETSFLKVLLTRLKILSDMGIDAVQCAEFERLKKSDGLYSMHLSAGTYNIRILYAFLSDGRPVLLSAFYERDDSRETDYTREIPKAQRRLEELEDHPS